MTDFEERLRAAMESSVADQQPPGNLAERVRHRHRRHLVRVAVAGIAAVAAGVAVVPPTGAALLGGGQDSPHRVADAGRICPCNTAKSAGPELWLRFADVRETLAAMEQGEHARRAIVDHKQGYRPEFRIL